MREHAYTVASIYVIEAGWVLMMSQCTAESLKERGPYAAWKGHGNSLDKYGQELSIEFRNRGFRDTYRNKFRDRIRKTEDTEPPLWIGNKKVHDLHKSFLLTTAILDATFLEVKRRPEIIKLFPVLRRTWKELDFKRAWKLFGKPGKLDTHYGRLGWDTPELPMTFDCMELYPQ